jgi:hypothetical protein
VTSTTSVAADAEAVAADAERHHSSDLNYCDSLLLSLESSAVLLNYASP